MNNKSILRLLIVAEWLLLAISIYISIFLESYLPQELQNYLLAESTAETTKQEDILIIASLVILAAYLISSIMLLLLKKWAKWPYLLSMVVLFLIAPFAGPTVEHSTADTIAEISTLISGMILSLIFFTDTLSGNNVEHVK
ncbi:MAG: hypothetical protein KQH63_22090 [Desulfobulbaceae bacterium]|nr:hypothetical protein [Desulfobulbaceae bacterium]